MLKLPMLKLMGYDLMYKILESGDVIITFKEFLRLSQKGPVIISIALYQSYQSMQGKNIMTDREIQKGKIKANGLIP